MLDPISGIIAGFIGAVLGNFATSPIFRLPRGIAIGKDNPFCDSCHGALQPRDLFPVLSWLLNAGKCRFCKAPIPSVYFWIELGFTLVSLAACWAYGLGERYVLVLLAVGGLLASAAMMADGVYVAWRALVVPLIATLLWVTLRDGSLMAIMDRLMWLALPLMAGTYYAREKNDAARAAPWYRHGLALAVVLLWTSVPSALSGEGLVSIGGYMFCVAALPCAWPKNMAATLAAAFVVASHAFGLTAWLIHSMY